MTAVNALYDAYTRTLVLYTSPEDANTIESHLVI